MKRRGWGRGAPPCPAPGLPGQIASFSHLCLCPADKHVHPFQSAPGSEPELYIHPGAGSQGPALALSPQAPGSWPGQFGLWLETNGQGGGVRRLKDKADLVCQSSTQHQSILSSHPAIWSSAASLCSSPSQQDGCRWGDRSVPQIQVLSNPS